jgi:hypothetical protein
MIIVKKGKKGKCGKEPAKNSDCEQVIVSNFDPSIEDKYDEEYNPKYDD